MKSMTPKQKPTKQDPHFIVWVLPTTQSRHGTIKVNFHEWAWYQHICKVFLGIFFFISLWTTSTIFTAPELQLARLLLAAPTEARRSLAWAMLLLPGSGWQLAGGGPGVHHRGEAQKSMNLSTARNSLFPPQLRLAHLRPVLIFGPSWRTRNETADCVFFPVLFRPQFQMSLTGSLWGYVYSVCGRLDFMI